MTSDFSKPPGPTSLARHTTAMPPSASRSHELVLAERDGSTPSECITSGRVLLVTRVRIIVAGAALVAAPRAARRRIAG